MREPGHYGQQGIPPLASQGVFFRRAGEVAEGKVTVGGVERGCFAARAMGIDHQVAGDREQLGTEGPAAGALDEGG